jgi:hypothetical protein
MNLQGLKKQAIALSAVFSVVTTERAMGGNGKKTIVCTQNFN